MSFSYFYQQKSNVKDIFTTTTNNTRSKWQRKVHDITYMISPECEWMKVVFFHTILTPKYKYFPTLL